uniref:Uncharacterized protein n=1 Tax=Cucumis sativus TaxID=3659 RepID=A0A0A0L953_CUCSA
MAKATKYTQKGKFDSEASNSFLVRILRKQWILAPNFVDVFEDDERFNDRFSIMKQQHRNILVDRVIVAIQILIIINATGSHLNLHLRGP